MKSQPVTEGLTARIGQFNDLREDARASSYFLAHQKSTPDLQLYVEAGKLYFAETLVEWAGGNSPTFTAPSTNPRIDLLVLLRDGTLSRVVGTEAASPTPPTLPDDAFPICQVYNRVGQGALYDIDTTGQGYVYKDVRSFANLPARKNLSVRRTYGETIVAQDALIVGNGEYHTTIHTDTSGVNSKQNLVQMQMGQTFTTSSNAKKIAGIAIKITDVDGLPHPVLTLYNAAGSPAVATGSALAQKGFGQVTTQWNGNYVPFMFDTPVVVSPNTQYAFIVHMTQGTTLNWYFNTVNPYGGGHRLTGSFPGTADTDRETSFKVFEILTTPGEVYKARANLFGVLDEYQNNFLGFASEGGAAGYNGAVVIDGVMGGFTGLTVGVTYYLDDQFGLIVPEGQQSSFTKKIGRAISTTEILIIHDNN